MSFTFEASSEVEIHGMIVKNRQCSHVYICSIHFQAITLQLSKPFPAWCNVEMLGDYKLQDKALPKCLIDGATLIRPGVFGGEVSPEKGIYGSVIFF